MHNLGFILIDKKEKENLLQLRKRALLMFDQDRYFSDWAVIWWKYSWILSWKIKEWRNDYIMEWYKDDCKKLDMSLLRKIKSIPWIEYILFDSKGSWESLCIDDLWRYIIVLDFHN